MASCKSNEVIHCHRVGPEMARPKTLSQRSYQQRSFPQTLIFAFLWLSWQVNTSRDISPPTCLLDPPGHGENEVSNRGHGPSPWHSVSFFLNPSFKNHCWPLLCLFPKDNLHISKHVHVHTYQHIYSFLVLHNGTLLCELLRTLLFVCLF